MIIFTPQNITLLVASLINLAMSIFILTRSSKNKINLYFSLLTFFVFLWSLGLFLARVFIAQDIWVFWMKLTYPAAIGVMASLFYFCFYYPFPSAKIKKSINFFLWPLTIFLAFIVYVKKLFIIGYETNIQLDRYTLFYNKPMYIFYGAYFILVVVFSLILLIKKYHRAEVIFKKQILILLITIIIAFICGSYFDLITCYFGDFRYFWLGPIFTFFMNAVVFYLIISPKEKING